MATACTTWLATFGNGAATGIGSIATSRLRAKTFVATPVDRLKVMIQSIRTLPSALSKEVHSFATPPTARAIAPARAEERRPTPVRPTQVSGALCQETTRKLPARSEANLLSQNKRLLALTTPKLMKYKPKVVSYGLSLLTATIALIGAGGPLQAQEKKPNIVVIMGDDIGWFNIGAYHEGIMSGRTPNLDKLASQGMRFTDYYAEASCTAGRANFITGELPIRTGMTTVGQPGADVGLPAEASTIATALKEQGYETGQFGKNHLGDLNKFLPTVHGFDEYFGYLYHLDAMPDPFWYSYPTDPAIRATVLPRNLVHCWATDVDDPTVDPRWGKVGKQKIVDEGPLSPGPNTGRTIYGGDEESQKTTKYNMTTIDEVLVEDSIAFMKKAKADGKPFFLWHNDARCHVWTFLSPKYKAMMNADTNFGLEEAAMAEMDDCIGALM